jgi:hypothetical protein
MIIINDETGKIILKESEVRKIQEEVRKNQRQNYEN